MLIIVHYRNVQLFHKPSFNLKALRCPNILEIYASKGRCYCLDRFNESIHIGSIYLYVENVDICECLEQKPLPLHYWLAS